MNPRAKVRVFVLTYRRPALLRRALRSLLGQTFRDWVCELHNDAPDDPSPQLILEEVAPGDSRFVYCQHIQNEGAVACFNRVFKGGPEPYAALLEDDNWWEPGFLSTLLPLIEATPDASLIWANMQIWHEQPDGTWLDSGRTIWHCPATATPMKFIAPELIQAFDALHSNGAMIFRPAAFEPQEVPAQSPFAIIEALRERAATGSLLFCPTVLANFAVTRDSSRSKDPVHWVQAQLLLAASFFAVAKPRRADVQRLWSALYRMTPPGTDILFLTAAVLRDATFIQPGSVDAWLRFLASAVRHPKRVMRIFQFRAAHPETWQWLQATTRRWCGVPHCSLTDKTEFAVSGAATAPASPRA